MGEDFYSLILSYMVAFKTRTWWLFLANVTMWPPLVIFKPQQRDTYKELNNVVLL